MTDLIDTDSPAIVAAISEQWTRHNLSMEDLSADAIKESSKSFVTFHGKDWGPDVSIPKVSGVVWCASDPRGNPLQDTHAMVLAPFTQEELDDDIAFYWMASVADRADGFGAALVTFVEDEATGLTTVRGDLVFKDALEGHWEALIYQENFKKKMADPHFIEGESLLPFRFSPNAEQD